MLLQNHKLCLGYKIMQIYKEQQQPQKSAQISYGSQYMDTAWLRSSSHLAGEDAWGSWFTGALGTLSWLPPEAVLMEDGEVWIQGAQRWECCPSLPELLGKQWKSTSKSHSSLPKMALKKVTWVTSNLTRPPLWSPPSAGLMLPLEQEAVAPGSDLEEGLGFGPEHCVQWPD